MSAPGSLFSADQWERLTRAFHTGSTDASAALAKWIDGPAEITIDGLQQWPLEDVGAALPRQDAPLCFCVAPFTGELSGSMLLAFDDSSGHALADSLSGYPPGTTNQWDELADLSPCWKRQHCVLCISQHTCSDTRGPGHEPFTLTAHLLPRLRGKRPAVRPHGSVGRARHDRPGADTFLHQRSGKRVELGLDPEMAKP